MHALAPEHPLAETGVLGDARPAPAGVTGQVCDLGAMGVPDVLVSAPHLGVAVTTDASGFFDFGDLGTAWVHAYVFSNLFSNFWQKIGNFLANFERPVLGCIDAKFCK